MIALIMVKMSKFTVILAFLILTMELVTHAKFGLAKSQITVEGYWKSIGPDGRGYAFRVRN